MKLIPKIVCQKYAHLFFHDEWALQWTTEKADGVLAGWLKNNTMIATALTGINCILLFFSPFALLRKDKMTIFLSTTWMGYICFLLASGVQKRYRFLILPFQIVLAVLGSCELKKRMGAKNHESC